MNAYLFSAGCTTTAIAPTPGRGGQTVNTLRTWDGCSSAIIYGGNAEQAQKRFETWLSKPPDAEAPTETVIKKIVATQLIDDLLVESGSQPPDWPELARQMSDPAQCAPMDDFEQGYWVDINQALPAGKISFDVDSLRRDLAEDVRSGLNWSPEKQFFFLISVLSRPLPPSGYFYREESAENDPDRASDADSSATEPTSLDGSVLALPELMDKESAALVQARNSVVAAWLWRKFAADTPVARNDIYLSPCCALIPVE